MYKRLLAMCGCICVLFTLPFSSFSINVSAKSAVVVEMERGEVVFEKDAYRQLPMASTTKIMTALLAVESGKLEDIVTVDKGVIGVEGSSVYLKNGEKIKLHDLVYALMLASANDAAEAIAVYLSGSVEAFAEQMNKRASQLGLVNTSFANPHGLDADNHYTTAYDLAMLTVCALKNDTFKTVVSCQRYTIEATDQSPARYLVNHNKMLRFYEGTVGVKTGFTKKCGRCLVSAAEKDGVGIVAVTLSAPDDWNDHKAMLDLGFQTVRSVCLAKPGSLRYQFPVICDVGAVLTASNKDSVVLSLKKDSPAVCCKVLSVKGRYLFAPIEKDEHIADAVFYIGDKEVARAPLYAEQTVKNAKSEKRLFDFFKK